MCTSYATLLFGKRGTTRDKFFLSFFFLHISLQVSQITKPKCCLDHECQDSSLLLMLVLLLLFTTSSTRSSCPAVAAVFSYYSIFLVKTEPCTPFYYGHTLMGSREEIKPSRCYSCSLRVLVFSALNLTFPCKTLRQDGVTVG
uniref:Uncharacterized protein n=1 Tax=Trypanosoma vivax (strain Y486) TaxID=1055687 RepID=G0TYI4_TRYVY|nr:hypothetical protein TVY486_0703650 [Trypanosoma vivax Y486]